MSIFLKLMFFSYICRCFCRYWRPVLLSHCRTKSKFQSSLWNVDYLRENDKIVVKNLKTTTCVSVPIFVSLSPRAKLEKVCPKQEYCWGYHLGKPSQEFYQCAWKFIDIISFCYDNLCNNNSALNECARCLLYKIFLVGSYKLVP